MTYHDIMTTGLESANRLVPLMKLATTISDDVFQPEESSGQYWVD